MQRVRLENFKKQSLKQVWNKAKTYRLSSARIEAIY